MATVAQGLWGLLIRGSYDAHDVCVALPAWTARVEKEEATKGVASAELTGSSGRVSAGGLSWTPSASSGATRW